MALNLWRSEVYLHSTIWTFCFHWLGGLHTWSFAFVRGGWLPISYGPPKLAAGGSGLTPTCTQPVRYGLEARVMPVSLKPTGIEPVGRVFCSVGAGPTQVGAIAEHGSGQPGAPRLALRLGINTAFTKWGHFPQ